MTEDLETFVTEVSGTNRLRVEEDLGGGFVRLRTSEAERRQALQDVTSSEDIVLELLRNAVDAHATQIFLATGTDGGRRRIVVLDNGDGVPPSMQQRIFEPRVTSKLNTSHRDKWGYHGRGMALYSISQNALSARVACSDTDRGASFEVVVDRARLSEKTDQSTFPTFTLGENRTVSIRGPRNIIRMACEFSLEEHDRATVYAGSAAEIAAALFDYGKSTLSAVERTFCSDSSEMPVCKQLACVEDPRAFAERACALGLELSERTARRIMDGELEPAKPLLDRIELIDRASKNESKPLRKSHAGGPGAIKLGDRDRKELASATHEAFRTIAERYYLNADVKPEIRVSYDRITVSFPIVRDEDR